MLQAEARMRQLKAQKLRSRYSQKVSQRELGCVNYIDGHVDLCIRVVGLKEASYWGKVLYAHSGRGVPRPPPSKISLH